MNQPDLLTELKQMVAVLEQSWCFHQDDRIWRHETDSFQMLRNGKWVDCEPPPGWLEKISIIPMECPPDEIVDAARKVEMYFKEKGIEKWEFLGIKNRF